MTFFFFTDNSSAATVPRPSELFYSKLTPLLEAEGLNADPRQRAQWPTETLRRVLADLMEETPKDLVSRELWQNAIKQQILLDRMEKENRRIIGKLLFTKFLSQSNSI